MTGPETTQFDGETIVFGKLHDLKNISGGKAG
jgi:hypothetical protein